MKDYIELEVYLDIIASKIASSEEYNFFEEFKDELNCLLNIEKTGKKFIFENKKWYVFPGNNETVVQLIKEFNNNSPHEFATNFLINI